MYYFLWQLRLFQLVFNYKNHIYCNVTRHIILGLIFKGIVGLGLIFNGRIKGHITTRFVLAMNALCVSSFSNRILDIGYISSHSSLGLVGVKVGTII